MSYADLYYRHKEIMRAISQDMDSGQWEALENDVGSLILVDVAILERLLRKLDRTIYLGSGEPTLPGGSVENAINNMWADNELLDPNNPNTVDQINIILKFIRYATALLWTTNRVEPQWAHDYTERLSPSPTTMIEPSQQARKPRQGWYRPVTMRGIQMNRPQGPINVREVAERMLKKKRERFE
ncbi:MAG: hypothetical protein QW429_00420 [Thermoprotei archaeon]